MEDFDTSIADLEVQISWLNNRADNFLKIQVLTRQKSKQDDDLCFDPTRKKRSKKTKKMLQKVDPSCTMSTDVAGSQPALLDSKDDKMTDTESKLEPDYSYTQLLSRVFDQIAEHNAGMGIEKCKKSIEPPEVGKIGTKKIVWTNFLFNCRSLNRKPQHLVDFVLVELGTTGALDGTNKLVIKGRYSSKQLESILTKYIKEYVACSTCHFLNTELQRHNRILFKTCLDCGASSSVSSICQGFRAQTRRKKQ